MDDVRFSEDIQFWEQLLKGKQSALSWLFRKYYKPLLNYGLKLITNEELIKDSIQELFLYIWERRNNLSEVAYVRSYLYTSLRRMVLRQAEIQDVRNQRDQSYSKVSFRDIASQEKLIILNELEREQREQLQEALETLSERQKEAIFLKFYGGLSNDEIARVMEVKRQSVYNYIYRAVEALKEYVESL